MISFALIAMFVFAISSCEDSSNANVGNGSEYATAENDSESNSDDISGGEQPEDASTQMVTCPACNGSGVIECMPGDLMAPKSTCQICGGKGTVDIASACEFLAYTQQNNASDDQSEDPEEIAIDLEKRRSFLDDMIQDREECESYALKTSYDQMIEEEKESISQLEDKLNESSY